MNLVTCSDESFNLCIWIYPASVVRVESVAEMMSSIIEKLMCPYRK